MVYEICIQYRSGGVHYVLLRKKDGTTFDLGAYRTDHEATIFANELAGILKKDIRHIPDGK